jgi:hypothetical protein
MVICGEIFMNNVWQSAFCALLISIPVYTDTPEQPLNATGRPPLYINVNYIPNENNFVVGDSAIKLFFMRCIELAKDAAQSASEECTKFAGEQKIVLLSLVSHATSYVSSHKFESALTTLLLAYSGIQARLIYLNRALSHPHNWSLWRAETPLEEFFSLSQQQLCSEILAEVQRRYATPNTVHDVVHSITRFIADTEREIELLREYQQYAQWLSTIKIRAVSLINSTLLESCADRIQRISYLKGTFLGWITEYRLGIRPAGTLF